MAGYSTCPLDPGRKVRLLEERLSQSLSILLLHGDPEARLLANAAGALQAALPHCAVKVTSAWATRPDLLARDAAPLPASLCRHGLLPDADVRDLVEERYQLVVLSLLAGVVVPVLRCTDGGAFVAHHGLRARWSAEDAEAIAAKCVEEPFMSPSTAATMMEPIINRLQDSGAAVAICTTFRHVREPLEHRRAEGPPSLRELIRRCNLEAARVSRRTGCFVLDLDRLFAQMGGAALGADCWGGGERAAELALDELMALLFDAVPDAAMPADPT